MTRKDVIPSGESVLCNLCGGKVSKHIFTKNDYRLVQCTECELVYVSNPPSLDELRRIYSFNANYHVEFRSNDIARTSQAFQLLKNILVFYKSMHRRDDYWISDVRRAFFLKVASDCGWEVLGIELSADSAALAIERYRVPVRVGRVEDIQLQRGSFECNYLMGLHRARC